MVGSQWWAVGAGAIAGAVAAGRTTATEVLEAHLARIDAVNPRVNAITQLAAEQAREQAEGIDRRVAAGAGVGPLAGVPFTVKESIALGGTATTHGVPRFRAMTAAADSPSVAALRRADAVPVGHTNMPTLTLRGMHTTSELWGATVNPWDASRTPGGSSGGDAVAVATGMAVIGLGNDSGGSLRLPATFTGTCGLKPTPGRFAQDHRIGPADPTLASQLFPVDGPIARDVADLRPALQALAGSDPADPRAVPVPVPGPPPEGPIRVGLARDPGGAGLHPDVAAALTRAADALADAGYVVEDIELPRIDDALAVYHGLIMTEFQQNWPSIKQLIGPDAARYIELTMQLHPPVDLPEYLRLTGLRLTVQRSWAQLATTHPLVLGPVSTVPSFAPDEERVDLASMQRYGTAILLNSVTTVAGVPAVAVPTGTVDGFPQGVQIIGPAFREDLCLDAAEVVQPTGLTPLDPAGGG